MLVWGGAGRPPREIRRPTRGAFYSGIRMSEETPWTFLDRTRAGASLMQALMHAMQGHLKQTNALMPLRYGEFNHKLY